MQPPELFGTDPDYLEDTTGEGHVMRGLGVASLPLSTFARSTP